MPKIAAVTGASGLIGKYLVNELHEQGWHVRVLGRRSLPVMGKVEFVRGDLSDPRSLKRFLEGARVLFHCAAELHNEKSMYAVNVQGTRNIAKAAVEAGVHAFCHLSSAGVVGPVDDAWVDECTPCHPASTYERTKWQAEQLVRSLDDAGMRVIVLRPTNVVDEIRPGVLAAAIRNSFRDRIYCMIKGAECVHLIHALDVARAACFLTLSTEFSATYIVGCDETPENTFAGTYVMVQRYLGRKDKCSWHLPVGVPNLLRRLGRGRSLHGRTRFSSAKLKQAGFEPLLGLEGCILRICIERGRL